MGFKLPGIKKAGSSLENLDLNIKTRLPRNDVYRGTVISRKAAMTARARQEKGDPTVDPFGATFQPLDTRKYATSAKFPYIKSRFRVTGDASNSFEGSSGEFTRTATGGYRELPTKDEYEYNRLGLRFQAPTGDGYGAMEKQARDSAKISKAVGDAYAAYVRGDISQAEYKKTIEDQVPVYKETQAQPGAWEEAQSMTLKQLQDYYTLAKDAKAAQDLVQYVENVQGAQDLPGYISEAQSRLVADERSGELIPMTSTEDYLESLRPTALDERSGNFLVDGSGLMMRATEEDIAERYKKTKK
jgi:hypothetical protein